MPPFENDKVKSIEIGRTTQADIEQLFGGFPSGSRRNGKVYIYAKPQRLFYAETIAWPGTTTLHTVSRLHLLIIKFDNNAIVTEFDICAQGDKIGGNLFIANNGESDFIKGTRDLWHNQRWDTTYWDNYCIIYDYSKDIEAKAFQAPVDKAVIYYYRKKPKKGSMVCFDSMRASDCDVNGFLFWVVDPGIHTVGEIHPGAVVIVEEIHSNFEAGKMYFLQSDGENHLIVSNNIGIKEIKERTLILDKLDLSHF